MPKRMPLPRVVEEFAGAELGDERLDRRLVKVAETVAAYPARSFPKLCSTDGELEGLYRLLGNERVVWQKVLAPHVEQTARRCRDAGRVFVLHDTTEFAFKTADGARRDLGYLQRGHRGFKGHMALAVTDDEHALPLGLLGLEPIVREKSKGGTLNERAARSNRKPKEAKESRRWERLAAVAESKLEGVDVIHVMDREADNYRLLKWCLDGNHQFVVRVRWDRELHEKKDERVSEVLSTIESRCFREVQLAPHEQSAMKQKLRRTARLANLHVRGARLTVKAPLDDPGEPLSLNVVEVFEVAPPRGEQPLTWKLYTSEPIDTVRDIERVVDAYRQRWVIEEYFKALKTGCSYERRQLMTLHGLLNTLALLAPLAWRILALRSVARTSPDAPASELFENDEIELLRRASKKVVLGGAPTAREVLLAIAGLGGHLKRNGDPGWQTLWAGYEELLVLKRGWDAARCDQS